jgi:hypothetical protein
VGWDGKDLDVIWVDGEAEYFYKRDWTGGIALIRFAKLDFSQHRSVASFSVLTSDWPVSRATGG